MNDRVPLPATLEDSAFFMPFSMNRHFKKAPRLMARAQGMYYYTPEGKKLIDGTSGLWCVNAGHCRERIVKAVQQQVAELDFAPTFQMGHPLAFEFADKLAALAPAT
jgi:beta-alanine--pyruvate transaminase